MVSEADFYYSTIYVTCFRKGLTILYSNITQGLIRHNIQIAFLISTSNFKSYEIKFTCDQKFIPRTSDYICRHLMNYFLGNWLIWQRRNLLRNPNRIGIEQLQLLFKINFLVTCEFDQFSDRLYSREILVILRPCRKA